MDMTLMGQKTKVIWKTATVPATFLLKSHDLTCIVLKKNNSALLVVAVLKCHIFIRMMNMKYLLMLIDNL